MDSAPRVGAKSVSDFVVRWAVETGLSVGTGLVADTVHKHLLKKGAVPAAILAVGGAAALKAFAKGGMAAVDNQMSGRQLDEGVPEAMLGGFRTGLIDATHSLIAPSVVRHLGGKLSPLAARALTGAGLWSVNGAVTAASAPGTWQAGAKQGLTKVGEEAAAGMATGVITGSLGSP